jgi:L-fuconolactonase
MPAIAMPTIIDTHIHIWDFNKAEYSWLNGNTSILGRNYTIDIIESDRAEAGITEGILVQAANNLEDTDFMLETADNTDWIKGVVGWLPMENADELQSALSAKYLHNPYFKGVRHLMHDEPSTEWLLQDNVLQSLQILADNNLPYEIVAVVPAHIKTALKLAEKIPNLKMVFDHLSQPPIASKQRFGEWGMLMMEAAQHSNFYAKISGLGTASKNFGGWQPDDIKPHVEFVINHFGPGRCFCGGDWPVSLLAGSYVNTWDAYKNVLSSLVSEIEKNKILFDNAASFYQL